VFKGCRFFTVTGLEVAGSRIQEHFGVYFEAFRFEGMAFVRHGRAGRGQKGMQVRN